MMEKLPFIFLLFVSLFVIKYIDTRKMKRNRRRRQTYVAASARGKRNKQNNYEGIEYDTHISTESFKCQLCRFLSVLMEFLLSDGFALLELLAPARCMKPMLYHFLVFSHEFSCGFVPDTDGFFGLFSTCGCGTEPSQFALLASQFSTEFLASHSSWTAGWARSTSSVPRRPAEFSGMASGCVTSSHIFYNFSLSLG